MTLISPYLEPIMGVLNFLHLPATSLLQVTGWSLLAVYACWLLYLALTNIWRAAIAKRLSYTAYTLALPAIGVGVALDVALNFTVFSALFLERPTEWTISERLRRHNTSGTGWRKTLAGWFEPLLDPFDPDGDHI